ncbi:RagB/SusD family nutrient uptake outer membrane protein [Chryseobacterium sp.]|uniref:RagB/SusD family nutrient uptake outer membrane protein n=1 Tax=Chryseobacterium sp. TaxID=1871047 RepID=UPI0032197A41
MKKIFAKVFLSTIALSALAACNDEGLEPTLSQSKIYDENINTVEDLRTAMNGGYERLQSANYYGRDVIIFGEVRSDNTYANGNSNRFPTVGQMNMQPTDAYSSDSWTKIYQAVSNTNIVINKPAEQLTGSPQQIQNIKGQAYAMRALAHFDLLRIYGQQFINGQGGMNALGVPYIKVFRDVNNLYPTRNTVQQNYDEIMKDLDTAINLMDGAGIKTNGHYLTSMAAHALKARIALYFKKYQLAEDEAKIVVESAQYEIAKADDYLKTFKDDLTKNIIFSLDFNLNDNLGNNSLASIYRGTAYGDIVALKNLYDAYDTNDIRKTTDFINDLDEEGEHTGNWRNIGKYPTVGTPSDDVPLIRIEEVVLIYAEALLNNGKAGDALVQLNSITAKRNANAYTAATMDNILSERRKELAFEGFRFDDIARTGKAMPLVDPLKQKYGNVPFGSFKYAFPIPLTEIGPNANMKQNFGYN